jgi:hypothetical protein
VTTRTVTWRQIASHALTLVGALWAAYFWAQLTMGGGNPADASTYYRIHLDDLYGGWYVGGPDAYQYSPVFAQLLAPLHAVPFDVLVAVWRAAALAIVVWLAGPFSLPILLLSPVASEVNAANINIFLAGAIAAGFRYPGLWSTVLLTKVTPGIGLLWFLVRREWSKLGVALGVTIAVAAVSFLISPGQWIAWLGLVASNTGAQVLTPPFWVPLAVRLPLAAIAIYYGARLNHRWMVPIGAMIAAPVLYFPTQSIALGALPFLRTAAGNEVSRIATWVRRRRGAPLPPEEASATSATDQPLKPPAEGDQVPAKVLR